MLLRCLFRPEGFEEEVPGDLLEHLADLQVLQGGCLELEQETLALHQLDSLFFRDLPLAFTVGFGPD